MALGAALSFAVNNIFSQRGLVSGNPEISVLLGNLLSMCLFGVAVAWLGLSGQMPTLSWLGIALFAMAGVLSTMLGRSAEAMSIQHIGATRFSSMRMLDPVFGYALSILFLGDQLQWQPSLGILAVFIGLQILANERQQTGSQPALVLPPSVYWRGIALAVVCSLLMASSNIFRKSGMGVIPAATFASLIASTVGSLLACLNVAMRPSLRAALVRTDRRSALNFLMAGLGSAGGQYFMFAALGVASVPVVSTLRNTAPWFTMALGAWLLTGRDRITYRLVVSTVCMMAGVLLVLFR